MEPDDTTNEARLRAHLARNARSRRRRSNIELLEAAADAKASLARDEVSREVFILKLGRLVATLQERKPGPIAIMPAVAEFRPRRRRMSEILAAAVVPGRLTWSGGEEEPAQQLDAAAMKSDEPVQQLDEIDALIAAWKAAKPTATTLPQKKVRPVNVHSEVDALIADWQQQQEREPPDLMVEIKAAIKARLREEQRLKPWYLIEKNAR